MKSAKRIFAVLFAAVLVLAMATTAFADDDTSTTHSITVSYAYSGHTYTAYQIFAGDVETLEGSTVLTNITWGSGVDGDSLLSALKSTTDTNLQDDDGNSLFADCTTAEDVANVLRSYTTNNGPVASAFAAVAGQYVTSSAGVSSSGSTYNSSSGEYEYTISGLSDGYYLVMDTTETLGDGESYTKYLLQVVGEDVTVEAKADTPSKDKTIVGADDGNGYGTAVNVGDTVTFQVTSTVPEMDGYSEYTYTFTDTMSSGLTFTGATNVSVTIGGNTYTDFTVSSTENNDGTTTITIAFNNFINQASNAGQAIVITYSATLNENALETDVETNTVYLTYSNDPYDTTSTGTTPEDTVYVYDFDIVIDKVDSQNNSTKLEGAKFVLYKYDTDGTTKLYYKYTEATDTTAAAVTWVSSLSDATEVTTDSNGAASFVGLDSGTYYLQETEAPEGYNLVTTDTTVTITVTYNADGTIASSTATSTNNGQYSQSVTVENKSGSILPSTGGMGTTVLYTLGIILVMGAGIALVVRRRMSVER